jgi:hypothetical protein
MSRGIAGVWLAQDRVGAKCPEILDLFGESGLIPQKERRGVELVHRRAQLAYYCNAVFGNRKGASPKCGAGGSVTTNRKRQVLHRLSLRDLPLRHCSVRTCA